MTRLHKKANKQTAPVTLRKPARRAFALFATFIVAMLCFTVPAFATGEIISDPLEAVDNLSSFIFSLIRAIGLILLGWGVVQVGLSFQSHDPSQRSQGFLTLAGGLVITFAKEILDLITK